MHLVPELPVTSSLSFLVVYNKDMKIESEKAQVRISSLSKYQSLISCFV